MKSKTEERPRSVGVAVAALVAGLGLLTGLAARAGARGLAVAAEPLSGHWLDIAKADHLVILEALEMARATKSTAKARRNMLFGRVRDGFVRHALWEESIIYPALRYADQAAAASDLCARHSDMKAALFDIERTPTDDPTWLTKLTALMRDFEVQARREEEELFPALRRAITAEEDVRLTALVNQQNRRFV
jgi:hemerythrin superfamily protein